jgi:hypothetical protein
MTMTACRLPDNNRKALPPRQRALFHILYDVVWRQRCGRCRQLGKLARSPEHRERRLGRCESVGFCMTRFSTPDITPYAWE